MKLLGFDYETFYDPKHDYTLRTMSPPEYILDDRFEVHMLAIYDLSKPAPEILLPHQIEPFLANCPPEETVSFSHNALFDAAITAWKYHWVPARMLDTLGMARALLPRLKRYSLGAVTQALFGRDSKGDVIHKVAGMHAQDIKNAGYWPTFLTYAMNDIRESAHILRRLLPQFPLEERHVMDLVLRAAVQPVLHADIALLESHLKELREQKEKLLRDCGYNKAALMSTAQFQHALEALGVQVQTKPSLAHPEKQIPAFAKSDQFMADLLEHPDPEVQCLAAARLSHKSTIEETRTERFLSIAKLPWEQGAMLPVPLRYGGAHTHRLSGEWKMNLQNLPRDKTKSKLRKALTAPPGHMLVAGDLSQIEARIAAVLCGQHELVQQFRDKEDVYARFASHVFLRTISKTHDPNERFIGKTAVLSLQYGAGATRFYSMVTSQARLYGIDLTDIFDRQVAEQTVDTYRMLYNGPRTWRLLDDIWRVYIDNNTDEYVSFGPVTCSSQTVTLPNRMVLRYERGDKTIYGAKLLENIVQALARILIMQAAVRLAGRGLSFALQAHDELVFVVPEDRVAIVKPIVEEELIRPPLWLPQVPLAAEVNSGRNYEECK
jgi:hypothetical protein